MNFTINGRLPSLNEYISRCRAGAMVGNRMKKESQEQVMAGILEAKLQPVKHAVILKYHFFEKNTRRDLDNVSGWAHKVVQDALVEAGILVDDSWGCVLGYQDEFEVDSRNPRIEVEIVEVI